jgi:hypothetical protein
MKKLRAYWRAFLGYCPACNLEAPAIDTCQVCHNYRGEFPPSKAVAAGWLMLYFHDPFSEEWPVLPDRATVIWLCNQSFLPPDVADRALRQKPSAEPSESAPERPAAADVRHEVDKT